MPNIEDSGAWPAYTYLICSETSKCLSIDACKDLHSFVIVVVILTVLKRYVDPSSTSLERTSLF